MSGTPGSWRPRAPESSSPDTLLALLATYGPCASDRLARLCRGWRWLVRRRLLTLWDEELVDVTRGDVWRLTPLGRERVEELKQDAARFERLRRTR
jgi:hypothetical protein